MKQQYTYSMPEEFMQDQSVPAHWRLLGIVNGFFINNKPVYASNEWFAEKLGCSIRTVTDAVSKLESLKKIKCERTRRSRVILPLTEIATNFHLRVQPTSISDSDQLLTNSYNNSDNKLSEQSSEREYTITSDLEEEKRPPRKKKVTDDMVAVFNLFESPASTTWRLREIERTSAQALFDTYGIETIKRRLKIIKQERKKGDPYFPEINTPSQLLDKMPNVERYLSV